MSSGTGGRVVSCGRADCSSDIAAAEAVTGPGVPVRRGGMSQGPMVQSGPLVLDFPFFIP